MTTEIFTPTQARCLTALLEQIIPRDEDPGAVEARVDRYIAGQMAGDLRHLRQIAALGLDSLDAEARLSAGTPTAKDFADLAPPARDALLEKLEASVSIATWATPPAEWFRTMVELALEGFYADTGNGGNAGEVSWKMIGWDPHVPAEKRLGR